MAWPVPGFTFAKPGQGLFHETGARLRVVDQVSDHHGRGAETVIQQAVIPSARGGLGPGRAFAGGLTIAISRLIPLHLEPQGAGLNPGLAPEALVTGDANLRPAAVLSDLHHVGDGVGIGLDRDQLAAFVAK